MFRSRRARPNQPTTAPAKGTISVDDAWKTLTLVNDWIKHGETKAGISLATAGVSGGMLFNILKAESHPSCLIRVAAILCGSCIAATGVFAGSAIWPKLNPKEDPSSVLYFDHIARKHKSSYREYGELLAELISDRERLLLEIASQVWANAHVAKRKYKRGSLALISLLGVAATLAFTAIAALLT